MSTALAKTNGAVSGENIIPLPQALPGAEADLKSAFSIMVIEGEDFITDGTYRCPVTKGPYNLKPYRNPSGKEVVELNGYRPTATPADPGDGNGNNTKEESGQESASRRYRKNFPTLKVADSKRSELIREDQNSERQLRQVLTILTEEEVKSAERTKLRMRELPAPDWTNGTWTFEMLVEFVFGNYTPCRNPKLLEAAIEEFIKSEVEANLRPATTDSKYSILRRLVKNCDSGIMVHQVPPEILEDLMHSGIKRRSWKKNRSNLNTFFQWSSDKKRCYCPTNPVTEITLRKKKDDYKVPTILTNEVVLDILTRAQQFKGGRLFLFCVVAMPRPSLQPVVPNHQSFRLQQLFPIQSEPDRGRVLVQTRRLFRFSQCPEKRPQSMPCRQERLLPVQNRRIHIVRIIRVPHLPGGQINRYRVPQRRMRIGLKVRVSEERQLQFFRPELHQVELQRHLVPAYDVVQHRSKAPTNIRQSLAVDVKRIMDELPVGNLTQLLFVFAQVHRPKTIAFVDILLKSSSANHLELIRRPVRVIGRASRFRSSRLQSWFQIPSVFLCSWLLRISPPLRFPVTV